MRETEAITRGKRLIKISMNPERSKRIAEREGILALTDYQTHYFKTGVTILSLSRQLAELYQI